jgi:hypothetical protein
MFFVSGTTPHSQAEREEEQWLAVIDEVYEGYMRKQAPLNNPCINKVITEPPAPPPVIETRPRRKNGELGRAIMDTLFHAGVGGMSLRGIALEINSKPSSVSGWIYNNRNHVSGLRKLSPGIYAYESSRQSTVTIPSLT